MGRHFALVTTVFFLLCADRALAGESATAIQWRAWNYAAFAEARASDKPIYLYLEAVWCHWCHVMQQTTLRDPDVVERLNRSFIPVRADHDAMPALANRYRAWGWPAQIWLSHEGNDLLRQAGFRSREAFMALLDRALAAAEADEPSLVHADTDRAEATDSDSQLGASLREKLQQKHVAAYDAERGGLALKQKFLDADSVEYDLLLARQGDAAAQQRARQTLNAALALIDPVWGGAYQYSTGGRWTNPHYEKIMRTQAAFLRLYAQGYAQFADERYLEAGRAIRRYLDEFLRSEEGGFYTSQDADLKPGQKAHEFFASDAKGRARQGMPRIDTHRYAQHNGLAAEALALWHAASGDERALAMAQSAMAWVEADLRKGDGYIHAVDQPGVYLADNLAVARAWLALHQVTGQREYLARAASTATFLREQFAHAQAGYTGTQTGEGPLAPHRDLDENISVTRFFNLLAHYFDRDIDQAAARHGMAYLSRPAVALRRIDESGVLLAGQELQESPVHATVVGARDDPQANALFKVLLRLPGWYRRIEWWDRNEGPLPNPDVQYPQLPRAAGYYCEAKRCSAPRFDADALRELVAERLQTNF